MMDVLGFIEDAELVENDKIPNCYEKFIPQAGYIFRLMQHGFGWWVIVDYRDGQGVNLGSVADEDGVTLCDLYAALTTLAEFSSNGRERRSG